MLIRAFLKSNLRIEIGSSQCDDPSRVQLAAIAACSAPERRRAAAARQPYPSEIIFGNHSNLEQSGTNFCDSGFDDFTAAMAPGASRPGSTAWIGAIARFMMLAFGLFAHSTFTSSVCAAAVRSEVAAGGDNRSIVFVNVNVVPMDSMRVLEGQTVIVRNGRIADMGAADRLVVPKGAQRIEGRGRFLMPGLADMHAHLKSPHEFPLYLANGVTTVYNLSGRPAHLAWREQIVRGEIIGPTLHTCGPIIFRCDSASEARRIVEEQKNAGYDSIKIYNDVSGEAYPVLVETARQNKMLVVGHIPRAPGLEGVLKAHQAIAHLEEYVYTFFRNKVDDESRIPEAVAATRAADVPVIGTLVNFDHILRQAEDLPAFLARPENKYLAPWVLESLGPARSFYHPRFKAPEKQQYLRKALAFQKTLMRELNRAGVRILVGTDAMNPGVVPGFSVLEEMDNLVESGLTPFETLRAATRYPGEFFAAAADFGTVAVGKRADLILLEANPLENITNISRRVGVMARGHWLTERKLRKMLEAVPQDYAREERFVKSRLERDPKQALQYLGTTDPFGSLAMEVAADRIVRKGFASFKTLHDEMKRNDPEAMLTQEWFLNDVGLQLLLVDRKKEAIDLFQLNTEAHPQSAGAWDSLARGHLKNGDKELAIQFYRKALEIDPKYASSIAALKKLVE